MPGASSHLLVLPNAAAAAGRYSCVATNASGSVTSAAATVSVAPTLDAGRLVNISCRALVGTGGDIIFTGFVVGGDGTSGSQRLLIRGSGPALSLVPFNVPGVLPDPVLTLNSLGTGAVVDSNSGWGGAAQIQAVSSAVGAFPWGSPDSRDAALLETLPAGNYTAEISGSKGDTGIALAEVYDATPAGTYLPSAPRLINLSARVQVGTGANVVVAGFTVGGTSAETVLVRVSGPTLGQAPFNVPGALADPKVTLSAIGAVPGAVYAANSGWGGDPAIISAAARVGAFPWSSSSGDSAVLITLPPGNYTATVSGASLDTGVALIEVYEVP